MNMGDEEYEELCDTLRAEANEQVEVIGRLVVAIESGLAADERRNAIDEAFRHAHNLKGAAGSLGFTSTAELAHGIESLLGLLRDTPEENLSSDLFDLLHTGLSAIPEALAADPGADTHPLVIEVAHRTNAMAGSGDTGSTSADPATSEDARKHKPTRRPPGRTGDHEVGGTPDIVVEAEPAMATPPPSMEVSLETGSNVRADQRLLKVKTEKLDALMTQVAELLSTRSRAEQRLIDLKELLAIEEGRLDRLRANRTSNGMGERFATLLSQELEHKSEQVKRMRELVRALEADALHTSILSGELQEDIRRIRTFPLSSTLDPLHRAVRNMAREAGKSVDLQVEGADVELDKKVLSALKEPIQHLLRNAIDHGIEPPDVRRRAGKPERGLVHVKAVHQGNTITITIIDDGAGVDVDNVREAAVKNGLLTREQANEASQSQLVDLLFAPAMTTKSEATGLSGRGVGLDAVRSMIESLRGSVVMDTKAGKGSTVTVALPVTVFVVHALLMRVKGQRFALPISAVQRILRVRPEEVVMVEQSPAIVIDGRPLALLDLSTILGLDARATAEGAERFQAVVIGLGRERFALAVEEILGDDTLLAKNFEPPLVRIKNIAGAAILGDGSVILMISPIDLLHSATSRTFTVDTRRSAPEAPPRILLADDTFTTRALERSVLEHAGFRVDSCADGAEALAKLRAADNGYDLVVSDVSMPNMSGIELCENIRADARLEDLPVVLVTSLDSEDDRRRGMHAGANAYITKGNFDHEQLVSTIDQLLGRA